MAETTEKRRDVVIYETATMRVESVAGRDLGETGFHTIDKRIDTVSGRINEHYDVAAVPVGKYNKGDTLAKEDIDYEV
jgi:hypothetical protein